MVDELKKILVPIGANVYPLNELDFIHKALTCIQPSCIFEWGTNVGRSARIFYEIGKFTNLNFKIFSFDLPDSVDHPEHAKEHTGELVAGCENVFLYRGDGLKLTLDFYKILRPDCLIFIDGDHEYDSVYRELEVIVENIPDAHVLLHDTAYSNEPGFNCGPYLAIRNILEEHPGQYNVHRTSGFPGMTLLERGAI